MPHFSTARRAAPDSDTSIGPKTQTGDITIVGNTPATLLTAWACAGLGAKVVLRTPRNGLASGFRSMEKDGRRIDLGARRLILSPFDRQTVSHRSYRPGMAVRPYLAGIKALYDSVPGLALREVGPSTARVNGHTGPDLQSTLDLGWAIRALGAEDAAAIAEETIHLTASATDTSDPDRPLGDASMAAHGATFHKRIIVPWAQKIMPDGWADIPARLAAKIWVPLFWSATLSEAAQGKIARNRTPLVSSYPAGGAFGTVIDALETACRAHPGICWRPYDDLTVHEDRLLLDGMSMDEDAPSTLALSASALSKAMTASLPGPPANEAGWDTNHLDIAWLEVPADCLETAAWLINVFEPSTPLFRVSRGGIAARSGHVILCIEMTKGSGLTNRPDALIRALSGLAIVSEETPVTWSHACHNVPVPAPTRANAGRLAKLHSSLPTETRAGIPIATAGTAPDWGADSLIEQTAQALAIAERLSAGW